MTDAQQARVAMVDALCATGRVRDPVIEAALREVPRHLFLPEFPTEAAYADEAVAVQSVDGVATSSASQPSMVAIMLEQLAVRESHQVLEIGAGTGYNAALLSRLVGPLGSVTSVDIDPDLIVSATEHLAAADVKDVELICGDGARGHLPGAPYDRIVLTVGSDDVRPEWIAQLAPEGRILLPLAVRGSQLSVAFDLGADGLLRSDTVRSCAFIRLRGIGAGGTPETTHVGGIAVQPAEGVVDAAGVAAALARPADLVPVPVPLGPADVWDGLGLWLSLTEPGAVRLLATDPDAALPDGMLSGRSGATIGLTSGTDLAVVVPTGEPGAAAVRPYGVAAPVTRLLNAVAAWTAAGSPDASDWHITVVPATAECTLVGPGSTPARIVVRKQHCLLLLEVLKERA